MRGKVSKGQEVHVKVYTLPILVGTLSVDNCRDEAEYIAELELPGKWG